MRKPGVSKYFRSPNQSKINSYHHEPRRIEDLPYEKTKKIKDPFEESLEKPKGGFSTEGPIDLATITEQKIQRPNYQRDRSELHSEFPRSISPENVRLYL